MDDENLPAINSFIVNCQEESEQSILNDEFIHNWLW